MNDKIITFVTGTRADFGKIKSLITEINKNTDYTVHIFVTGMHMLNQYGYTCSEVEKCGFKNIYKYINQNTNDTMDTVLSKTVAGFSDYIKEIKPDLIVVHGDRVEAMACAIVGSLNNTLVAHIEGGELSGTIDEMIRHSVSKLCHLHFVANDESRNRLIQLGENSDNIYIIGSPDIDIMLSNTLPNEAFVKEYYEIPYEKYGILLYHSVTTEILSLNKNTDILIDTLIESNKDYIVIYPNNDHGSSMIIDKYKKLGEIDRFKLFPSMRFEYFLSLLKSCQFIIGNSSAGVREAPIYGTPSINIGSRQNNRANAKTILNIGFNKKDISNAINITSNKQKNNTLSYEFGQGGSDTRFRKIINNPAIWETSTQKYFIDLDPKVLSKPAEIINRL